MQRWCVSVNYVVSSCMRNYVYVLEERLIHYVFRECLIWYFSNQYVFVDLIFKDWKPRHTLQYQHNTYYFCNNWTKRSVAVSVLKRNISGLSDIVDVSSWCTTNSSSNVNWASPVHLVPGDGRYSESCFSRTAIFVATDPRQRRNRYEKAN